MFSNFRTRRSLVKAADAKKEQAFGRSNIKGVFRITKQNGSKLNTAAITKEPAPAYDDDDCYPTIEAGLTFSMSEDQEDAEYRNSPTQVEDDNREVIIVKEEERTIRFTKKEVLQNELNHLRELRLKEVEVNNMAIVMNELKQVHAQRVAEKEREFAECKEAFEIIMGEKEEELSEIRIELEETKNELTKVCSVLISCQHALHDEQTKTMLSWKLW